MSAATRTRKAKFEAIPCRDLEIDERYQRTPRPGNVERIVRNFNERALGVLEVNRREDGTLVVIDGRHRLVALRQIGWREEPVACYVHDRLTLEEEAALFEALDDSVPLSRNDAFRSKLTRREPQAVAIVDIVTGAGYALKLEGKTGPGEVGAVGYLERIYALGVLRRTFYVVRGAWGTSTKNAASGRVLAGIAAVISRYPAIVRDERLAEVLGSTDPDELIVDAGRMAETRAFSGSGQPIAIGTVILKLYNRGLRASDRLPEPLEARRPSGGIPG